MVAEAFQKKLEPMGSSSAIFRMSWRRSDSWFRSVMALISAEEIAIELSMSLSTSIS